MKKIYVIATIFLFFISSHAVAFQFVAMSDSQGNDTGVNAVVFSKIIKNAVDENPAFVIVTGDLISGSNRDDIARLEYAYWKEIVRPISDRKIPSYVLPGNHCVQSPTQDALFQEVFDMPKNGPKGYEGLYYSFDYDNCHFIALHTDYYKRPGSVRLSWVADDLKAAKKEHIFVFGHDPAYPVGPHVGSSLDRDSTTREKFWALLVSYNVNAYICGHEHIFNKKCIDGVYQIINCASGGDIRRGYGGDFHGYMLVKVNGRKIEVIMKDENGTEKDRFFISGS